MVARFARYVASETVAAATASWVPIPGAAVDSAARPGRYDRDTGLVKRLI